MMLSLSFAFASCGNDPEPEPEPKPEPELEKLVWAISPTNLNFESVGDTKEVKIEVTSGEMKFENVTVTVGDTGKDWITVSRTSEVIKITADVNWNSGTRFSPVTVTYEGAGKNIVVDQKAHEGVKDVLIKVVSATGTSEETGTDPRLFAHSHDGDKATYFNSKFGEITQWPFFLEYTLQTPNKLNYIVYYPRTDSGNKWGSFNKFDVYVTTETNPEKVKVASVERGDGNHAMTRIPLEKPVENVKTVYFEIHSAYQNRVSCAEMEFYEVTGTAFDNSTIFSDVMCTALKSGVTETDVRRMPDGPYKEVAAALLAGTYDTNFRLAEFRPYQHSSVMAAINRIPHAYSIRDNPTGIYVEAGDTFYVLLEDTKGQNISIDVQNLEQGWGSTQTYALEKGENRFTATMSGLVYVANRTNDDIPLILETDAEKTAAAAKTVKIHFMGGKVQGYYRKGVTTMEQWRTIIAAAKFRDIDVIGDYAHLTWITEQFKANPNYVDKCAENLDKIVYQQTEFLGLVKYEKLKGNRLFHNRMYLIFLGSGAASATTYRTQYNSSYGEIFYSPDRFSARLWVLGHELGHNNQVGIRWAGTTEVSNNIFALYNQQQVLGAANRLSTGSYDNEKTLSDGSKYNDIYEAATAAYVTAQQPHGADMTPLPNADGTENTNENLAHWLKLVSFWQLQLYVADALGKKDFYADVYEQYRTCEPQAPTLSHGAQQLLFTEFCCKAANMDLTDYFEAWGFYRPIDRIVNDYGNKQLLVTTEMAEATKARIAAQNYSKPPHTAEQIIAIRDTNVNNYK